MDQCIRVRTTEKEAKAQLRDYYWFLYAPRAAFILLTAALCLLLGALDENNGKIFFFGAYLLILILVAEYPVFRHRCLAAARRIGLFREETTMHWRDDAFSSRFGESESTVEYRLLSGFFTLRGRIMLLGNAGRLLAAAHLSDFADGGAELVARLHDSGVPEVRFFAWKRWRRFLVASALPCLVAGFAIARSAGGHETEQIPPPAELQTVNHQPVSPRKKIMRNLVTEHQMKCSDGVTLYTVTVVPEHGEKFPAIIFRSPYMADRADREALAALDTHGYARVYQHCRGCGQSGGQCIPYVNERKDGLELLDWVRKQSFYNGEIFLEGSSYCASVHLAYLDTDPGDVKGAVLCVQDSERYNIIYRNGFFKPGLHGNWAIGMYRKNSLARRNFTDDTWLTRPLAGITAAIFGEIDAQLEEELRHPDPGDGFWKTPAGGSDYSRALTRCRVPVLLTTGWYDLYTGGVLDMWNSLSVERQKECALVVTPNSHGFDQHDKDCGLPPFPLGTLSANLPGYAYKWFDHLRTGAPLDFIRKGEIVYCTMFGNFWRHAPALPTGSAEKTLYLTRDRKLVSSPPQPGEPLTYCYNPAAPAKFPGGACLNFGGMRVQDPPDSRYDILSFVSEPFEEDLICSGPVGIELEVSSTAPDTCFYVRLDIVRDDAALTLRDDIDSLCRNHPDYRPGEFVRIAYSLVPHNFLVRRGDRIRLDVSSSCHPNFLVHPNRKGPIIDQTGSDIAYNSVRFGSSKLTLHVDPADR